ncbi:hypothetical protein GGR50DRAFT_700730 [Xylaria sp. CBS 124048]|nr:hypothetical protein GGR50DRAFT_700730 [Xylaria sp. CBS 124048]
MSEYAILMDFPLPPTHKPAQNQSSAAGQATDQATDQVADQETDQATDQVTDQVTDQETPSTENPTRDCQPDDAPAPMPEEGEEEAPKKRFQWGCTVPIDPKTKFPISTVITHVESCECPGPDRDGIVWVILERAHYLHQSNVVEHMIPRVNIVAQQAAIQIGINLKRGVETLPMYEGKVRYTEEGICVETLGRGFTPEEFESLHDLPPGQQLCSWVI